MQKTDETKASGDIEAVKKLLILDLVLKGLKQRQIALALGVSEATLSTMFPKGLLGELRGKGKRAISGDTEGE